MGQDQQLLAEKYETVRNKTTAKVYYTSLDEYLKNNTDLELGPNEYTDTGMINPNQVGIYKGTQQVGKIERILRSNKLILEHIKFYVRRSGYARKIYDHDEQFAKTHGINIVESELVNEVTVHLFVTTYTENRGWVVTRKGKKYVATLKGY